MLEIKKTDFVSSLPNDIQVKIKQDLVKSLKSNLGYASIDDISNGMDSRLCDLNDTIDIEKYINFKIDESFKFVDALKTGFDYLKDISSEEIILVIKAINNNNFEMVYTTNLYKNFGGIYCRLLEDLNYYKK